MGLFRFLFQSRSVQSGLDRFSGRRNRFTGRTRFTVSRGGRVRDSWVKRTSSRRFNSNFV